MRESMPRNGRRGDYTCVALIAAAVETRVAVENFAIEPGRWNAHAIAGAHDRRKVTHANQLAAAGGRNPHEGDHVLVRIVGVDPLESRGLMIGFPQRGLGAVDAIEVADQILYAAMVGLVEQIPIEAGVMIPFAPLAKFATHEKDFLPRPRPHVAEQRAQVGELLPAIARHLVQQGALAVNDLVVRERQHEIFEPRVDKSEGQIAMMKSPIDRLLAEVVECAVHPSHVPLETKTETADVQGTTDARP